jgi:hypothetical protein
MKKRRRSLSARQDGRSCMRARCDHGAASRRSSEMKAPCPMWPTERGHFILDQAVSRCSGRATRGRAGEPV